MRLLPHAAIAAASIVVLGFYSAPAHAGELCPGKSGYEWARCVQKENIRLSKKQGGNWQARLDRYGRRCAKQFPGPGPAGRDDRLLCVYQMLTR